MGGSLFPEAGLPVEALLFTAAGGATGGGEIGATISGASGEAVGDCVALLFGPELPAAPAVDCAKQSGEAVLKVKAHEQRIAANERKF